MSDYKIGERYKNIQVEFLEYSWTSFKVIDRHGISLYIPYNKSVSKPKDFKVEPPFQYGIVSFTVDHIKLSSDILPCIEFVEVKRPHWSLFYYLKKD